MFVSFTKLHGFTFLTIAITLTIFVLAEFAQGISSNSANGVLRDSFQIILRFYGTLLNVI